MTQQKEPMSELPVSVMHKKRGTKYEVIGIGRMQSEMWEERGEGTVDLPAPLASVDMREVVIYRSVNDGGLWVRPREEFEDGRFTALVAAPKREPAEPIGYCVWVGDKLAGCAKSARNSFPVYATPPTPSAEANERTSESTPTDKPDRSKFPYRWEGPLPPVEIIHQVINKYMGESPHEYDIDQFRYYLNNWEWHYTLNQRMREAFPALSPVIASGEEG